MTDVSAPRPDDRSGNPSVGHGWRSGVGPGARVVRRSPRSPATVSSPRVRAARSGRVGCRRAGRTCVPRRGLPDAPVAVEPEDRATVPLALRMWGRTPAESPRWGVTPGRAASAAWCRSRRTRYSPGLGRGPGSGHEECRSGCCPRVMAPERERRAAFLPRSSQTRPGPTVGLAISAGVGVTSSTRILTVPESSRRGGYEGITVLVIGLTPRCDGRPAAAPRGRRRRPAGRGSSGSGS